MKIDFSEINISIIRDYFNSYSLSGRIAYIVIHILLCAVILIKSDKKRKELFVYPGLFLLVFVLNPVFYYTIGLKLKMQLRFYRYFWILPIGILIAYYASAVICDSKKEKRFIVALLVFSLLILGGNIDFSKYSMAQNIYKISDEEIQLSELLHETDETEKPMVLCGGAPYYLWQYDGKLRWVLKRNDYMSYSLDVSDNEEIEKILEKGNAKKVAKLLAINQYPVTEEIAKKALDELDVDYIIMVDDTLGEDYFLKLGYQMRGSTGDYTVYKKC